MMSQIIVRINILILLIVTLVICSCTPLQHTTNPALNSRSANESGVGGKCMERLWVPDKLYFDTLVVAVYTGNQVDQEYIIKQTFIERPAGVKWIKKLYTENCLSKVPEDCMVWCLIEVPEVSADLYIVTDTTRIAEYQITEVVEVAKVDKRSTQEFRSVICKSDPMYSDYETQIITELHELGYIDDENLIKQNYLDGLKLYQATNCLPEGYLDLETLDSLGINY